MTQRRDLKICFAGFMVALVGAILGFSGFEIDQRGLSIIGFIITVVGVVVGCIGIVYGWLTHGKQAVTGSFEAARKLRDELQEKIK